ncbi:cysteine-rich receptor-like protein kinase 6 isoform X2 [Magnolia sinica]|uniref:cysteine-rich receptor-like protein kinase 6 isoform X2 n=1 Tax=Magnolia sinica TaxID=86752 RepID=UPI002658D3AE|nr:cysteine-rich receptor-like protein kinase 6 isoform X2 [Magnolia sinica]
MDPTHGPDIGEVDSLQLDLGTIRAATNNFSDANKLGESGFSAIYKLYFVQVECMMFCPDQNCKIHIHHVYQTCKTNGI